MPGESEISPQQKQKPKLKPRQPASPLQLKTGSPESGGGAAFGRRGSPKVEDGHRRSPRSPLPESPARSLKKGGSRMAELEKKLARAQEQIRKLREQVGSPEKSDEVVAATMGGEEGEESGFRTENELLKGKLAEAEAKSRETAEEAAASRGRAEQLAKQMEAMDAEMRTLRVQTEQWRKAAEAATAALAAATADPRGRRVAERCRSMDKSSRMSFEGGSPQDEGGRKKGGGIRALGDLWKKTAGLSKPIERR